MKRYVIQTKVGAILKNASKIEKVKLVKSCKILGSSLRWKCYRVERKLK